MPIWYACLIAALLIQILCFLKMSTSLVAPRRVDDYNRADAAFERDAVAELEAAGGVPLARVSHFERSVRDALGFRPGSVQRLRLSLRQLIDSSTKAEPAAVERMARGIIVGESEPGKFNRPSVIDSRRPAERLLDNVCRVGQLVLREICRR